MRTPTFTCPGITMPQPPDAPPEGYVACYRAGHTCTRETYGDDDFFEIRCPCCGEHFISVQAPTGGWR